MDYYHFMHRGYKKSVWTALIVSVAITTLVAMIGRSAVNIKGALALNEPTIVTVMTLVEPAIATGSTIASIDFLRKTEPSIAGEKPSFDYQVSTSNDDYYLVQLRWNGMDALWTIKNMEKMHR